MNSNLTKLYHVTESDYRAWCAKVKKPYYASSTRIEFAQRLSDGRLVKDCETGELKQVRRRSQKI